jgi:hypothetical protein
VEAGGVGAGQRRGGEGGSGDGQCGQQRGEFHCVFLNNSSISNSMLLCKKWHNMQKANSLCGMRKDLWRWRKMIDALECFVTVVELSSLSRAAVQLEMAVSSVSRKIDALEQELGARLRCAAHGK